MIVLDTNVISEMMKPADMRSNAVSAWVSRQPGQGLFTTAVTAAELLSGVTVLPAGRRKQEIEAAAERVLALFQSRILSLDLGSAPFFAEMATSRRKAGRPIDGFDLLIAAIARRHGMAVATRNVGDFEGCGVDIINPWGR